MKTCEFYVALKEYISLGKFKASLMKKERREIRRMSNKFTVKDERLFYVGPNHRYMRLVILKEDEKRSVLTECHHNPGTGKHFGVRSTRNRVVAGYFWPRLDTDVADWVRCCHHCQKIVPIKTMAPVLRSVKENILQVKEAWEVVSLDLIGPLHETDRGNKYVLTITDLYTKWVIAEPLKSRTVGEVSAAIVMKLYSFGLPRNIITEEGKEFVNEVNENIFRLLKVKHAVSGAYCQTDGQVDKPNQNSKCVLRSYLNERHTDWDFHLPAVVYGINTTKQSSTRYTPYFLLFHRHPRLPVVINTCPMEDRFEVGDPEEDLETRVKESKLLNEKVLYNIEKTQTRRQKTDVSRKQKHASKCTLKADDDNVLLSKNSRKQRLEDTLSRHLQGVLTEASSSAGGVAAVLNESGMLYQLSISHPSSHYRLGNCVQTEAPSLQDHTYWTPEQGPDHVYACPGPKLDKDLDANQDEQLKHILDIDVMQRSIIQALAGLRGESMEEAEDSLLTGPVHSSSEMEEFDGKIEDEREVLSIG